MEGSYVGRLALLDLLLQRDEGAMLERLDRPLGLAEDRRRLGVREVEDELQRQHLLLLVREIVDQLEQRLPADRFQGPGLRRGRLVWLGLGHLLFGLPALARAKVVHREVVGDAEEPGRERGRLPAELPDRLEHLQERLRRQVFGVVAVADGDVQVAVDPVEMNQIELFERATVALLGALDEGAHALCLALLPRRLGLAHR